MARTLQSAKRSSGKTVPKKGKALPANIDSLPLHERQALKNEGMGKRKRRWRQGTKALREIRHYQKGTDLLLQILPFQRVVREIVSECKISDLDDLRMQKLALPLLQQATEAYLIEIFEDSNKMGIHSRRVTVMKKDVDLAYFMRSRQTLRKRASVTRVGSKDD